MKVKARLKAIALLLAIPIILPGCSSAAESSGLELSYANARMINGVVVEFDDDVLATGGFACGDVRAESGDVCGDDMECSQETKVVLEKDGVEVTFTSATEIEDDSFFSDESEIDSNEMLRDVFIDDSEVEYYYSDRTVTAEITGGSGDIEDILDEFGIDVYRSDTVCC